MAARSSPGSRTNWRGIVAFLLLAGACSAGLALGVSTTTRTNNIQRDIRGRGEPCIAVKLPNGTSIPSVGCERLAGLLSETCALNPKLCRGVAGGRRPSSRVLARAVLREIRRRQTRARVQARRRAQRRSPGASSPHGGSTAPTPGRPSAPSGGGSGGSTSTPGSSSPPPTTPTQQPTVLGTANRTKDRVRDTGNDVTQVLGAGRPIPPLPDLTPALGPVCPKSPLC